MNINTYLFQRHVFCDGFHHQVGSWECLVRGSRGVKETHRISYELFTWQFWTIKNIGQLGLIRCVKCMLACIENNCEITYHCYYFRNHKFEILLTLYLGPSRNYVCSKAEFPESPFSRPDFESETAWDVYSRPIPSPSLDHWWISRSRPSPRRVLRRESRYFESDSPFFPLKSFNLCPYSNINTAQNVMTSPRPSPSLEHLWISRPSPRPKRVLDRETRPFESGTRDSGNSDVGAQNQLPMHFLA